MIDGFSSNPDNPETTFSGGDMHSSLAEEAYRAFGSSLTEYRHFHINVRSRMKTRALQEASDQDLDDIEHDLVVDYYEGGLPERYDPDKAKVSTFVVGFINKALNNLLRKATAQKRKEPYTVPYTEDEQIQVAGLHQGNGPVELCDAITPEDYCIGKELLELALEHFGRKDTEVLLGLEDRKAAAEELDLDYQAYCKRLARKTSMFKNILSQAGYC